jgi:hypothetical protein
MGARVSNFYKNSRRCSKRNGEIFRIGSFFNIFLRCCWVAIYTHIMIFYLMSTLKCKQADYVASVSSLVNSGHQRKTQCCEYHRELFVKFEMAPKRNSAAKGKLIIKKNLKSEILCQTPLNPYITKYIFCTVTNKYISRQIIVFVCSRFKAGKENLKEVILYHICSSHYTG